MPNVLSKLCNSFDQWSFRYNCYETVHPYTPYCSHSSLEIGLIVFFEAIKLYTPLYLCSQFARGKFDLQSFAQTAKSVLRSTSFISANAFFALLFFCSSQYMTGKFYFYLVAYLPAFFASCMAVMIEKPSRRSALAFYVSNVASDALFRIYVDKGYIKQVKNGQVYLFSVSIATIFYLAAKNGFENDPLSVAIKFVVGSDEVNAVLAARQRCLERRANIACSKQKFKLKLNNKHKNNDENNDDDDDYCYQDDNLNCSSICGNSAATTIATTEVQNELKVDATTNIAATSWLDCLLDLLVAKSRKLCNAHKAWQSCALSALKRAARAFLVGYVSQFSFKIITSLPTQLLSIKHVASINNSNSNNNNIIVNINVLRLALKESLRLAIVDKNALKTGTFLASFTLVFKLASYAIQRRSNELSAFNCALAALIAGPTFGLHKSPTLALYVLWKSFEILFHDQANSSAFLSKHKHSIIVVLYGLATSQLFYSAVLNPKYIKKSYLAFLDRMSRHRLHWINRNLLDVFGTQASLGYEDFFPDLHPKFVSTQFCASIFVWLLEQRVVADQLTW